MKRKTIFLSIIALMFLGITSCQKQLDLFPQNDLTPDKVYVDANGYKSVLAKIYGGLALTGNTGPAGSPDIGGGLDEGSQVPFIRMFFNTQELPTDMAVVAWNDQTIQDFHSLKWSSLDPFLRGIYARPIYNITLINEYLREAEDGKLSDRGITGAAGDDIKKSRAEVRFLRAFNYWIMMDLFGKSTFITEADMIGSDLPKEINRADLFKYIESELLAVENELAAPRASEYGRVDQAAAWALLARLYMNAETYAQTKKYTEAATYAKKVIDAGYALVPTYRNLFMADNHKFTGEIIWAVNNHGMNTQSYGNTTFFIHAASGDDYADYGAGGGWYGYRATKALFDKFSNGAATLDTVADKRAAMFFTSKYKGTAEQAEIGAISNFDHGLHVKKYVNIRTDGQPVSDPTRTYSDVDFPVFRLSEMMLIYAEAVLRGGSGSTETALNYVNQVRRRANAVNINQNQLTLNFILDERARELFWEGHRRTDLVRYNLFTTSTYLWPWKGGVRTGTGVDSKYNIYPIPAANLTANTNLTQNPGY